MLCNFSTAPLIHKSFRIGNTIYENIQTTMQSVQASNSTVVIKMLATLITVNTIFNRKNNFKRV